MQQMRDTSRTNDQSAAMLAMPRDEMNMAARPRLNPPAGDANEAMPADEMNTEEQTWPAHIPLPQPHHVTLHHHEGALTVDWQTAPNGYSVSLMRGRNEFLNQPCFNPPTTLLTDALPDGKYCVTVYARTPTQVDGLESDDEPCIVKLATPASITLAYNEPLQRLEVNWQPVPGAKSYSVHLVHLVAAATVEADATRWVVGGAAPDAVDKPLVQAWVQAKGDERHYADSNIGKSAPFALPVAGDQWGRFDITNFNFVRYFPEDDLVSVAQDGSTWTGRTDAEGQVYLDGLAAGVYTVTFPDFDATDWGIPLASNGLPATAAQATAQAIPATESASPATETPHWLVFELLDEDGQPVTGARYIVRRSGA